MNKKKDLAGALRAQDEPLKEDPQGTLLTGGVAISKAGGRSGMVNIAGWFPPNVKFELEDLRLARSRQIGKKITLQQIQAEAYNDLFKKYGRPEIAPSG